MFTQSSFLNKRKFISKVIAVALSGLISQGVQAQQWNLVGGATVTTGTGSYTNLVKDNAGNYYVSYYGAGVAQGSVQKFNGISWSFVGAQGVSPGFATYNALGVNASGEIYYSFQDGSNSNHLSVKKYSPVANSWSDAGVGISGAVVNYQNLKIVPSTNYPVVTYNASGLRAKRYDGTSWTDVGTSPILTGNQVNHSMVVGSNDTVYVAVQVGTAYSVYKNHTNAGSTAAWELVGTSGFVSGGSSNQFTVSLAIDAANNLYLAYRALSTPDASKIAVQKYSGGTWAALGNQFFSTSNVEHISIAVTPAGVPTVAFRENNPTDKTMVYTLTGTTWTSLGAASTTLGNWNSLILDNGAPVVAFCEGTTVSSGVITVKKYAPAPATITSIAVTTQGSVPATITTNAGTLQTVATILPSSINQAVTWSITPGTGAATISTTGLVTAQNNGTVYAKAISVYDPTKMDSLLITISNQIIPITGIDVVVANNLPATIITNAGNLQMQANVLPANANQAVTWSVVPGTGAATINTTGLVTAQSNGTIWAKAISIQDMTKMDSLLITISNQIIPIDSVVVTTQNALPSTITSNAGTLQMEAAIFPSTANQNVTWSIVPGTGAATINTTGLVTALTNGSVWAKAVSVGDVTKMDSLEITISNQVIPVDSVVVTTQNALPATITSDGGTLQIEAAIFPSTANQNVTWSIVAGTGTATINTTGLVTALTDGSVWAKAVSVGDVTKSDSLLITISNQEGTGIKNPDAAFHVSIYPNPTRNIVSLYVDDLNSTQDFLQATIVNQLGQVQTKQTVYSGKNEIDLSLLPGGIYFLKLNNGSMNGSYKIIKY
jgi:hypothetical protein